MNIRSVRSSLFFLSLLWFCVESINEATFQSSNYPLQPALRKMVLKKRVIVYMLTMSAAILFVGMIRRRQRREISDRKKKKKEGSINIGGIFGIDIGGTLSKIVYFERMVEGKVNASSVSGEASSSSPSQVEKHKNFQAYDTPQHKEALQEIYSAMLAQSTLGTTGVRDESLSFYSSFLGGRFHFIHFESRQMPAAIKNLSSTEITANIKSIGCTGGGAHKYAEVIKDVLEIRVVQFDELKCLIRGMHFVMMNHEQECYTYRYDDKSEEGKAVQWQRDTKDFCLKVHIPYNLIQSHNTFPYLVVSIGSGVSIMKVNAPGSFERVSGTSIGGGTYWGLCRLFTRCSTFEQVLDLAEVGNNAEVDMLVSDIYGGSYDQMNLKGSMVASNFGKLVMGENPREGLKEADLAISLLMMITNNIGQVAYLNAMLHGCKKVFFVGNFLRNNAISCRRLAFAISFWSKGTMEAMFLEHEGYFGALGAFLESAFGDKVDTIINLSSGTIPSEEARRGEISSNRDFFLDKEGAALHFVSPSSSTKLSNSYHGEGNTDNIGRNRTVSMAASTSPRSRQGNLMFTGHFQNRRNRDEDDLDELKSLISSSGENFLPQTPCSQRKRTQSLDSYANDRPGFFDEFKTSENSEPEEKRLKK